MAGLHPSLLHRLRSQSLPLDGRFLERVRQPSFRAVNRRTLQGTSAGGVNGGARGTGEVLQVAAATCRPVLPCGALGCQALYVLLVLLL